MIVFRHGTGICNTTCEVKQLFLESFEQDFLESLKQDHLVYFSIKAPSIKGSFGSQVNTCKQFMLSVLYRGEKNLSEAHANVLLVNTCIILYLHATV